MAYHPCPPIKGFLFGITLVGFLRVLGSELRSGRTTRRTTARWTDDKFFAGGILSLELETALVTLFLQ